MTIEKRLLVKRALDRHRIIEPCAGRKFSECFTVVEGKLTFWYNDSAGSTHIARAQKGAA